MFSMATIWQTRISTSNPGTTRAAGLLKNGAEPNGQLLHFYLDELLT